MEKYSTTSPGAAVLARSSAMATPISAHGLGVVPQWDFVFQENHRSWINPPRRCQKLFNKAFRMPEGSKLVIVRKEEEDE